jgi:hypothetical protein
MPRWPNSAALLTLLIIVVMVILPLVFVTSLLLQEVADAYKAFQSGEITIGAGLQQAREALPGGSLVCSTGCGRPISRGCGSGSAR